jgi:hypothetical protein
LQFVYQKGIAYGFQMGLRPQTLYGIADSPVGLAAYFLDHDARSYALIARVFDGQSEGLTRDDILDNITITWFTNTALSGARLYWENWGKLGYFNSPTNSIQPRAAGPRRPFPSSSISTRLRRAATSRLGNSRKSFQKRSARASDHCVDLTGAAAGTKGTPPSHEARGNNRKFKESTPPK